MTIDISNMEKMPSGEHAMAERLRVLRWDRTDQFFNHAIYLAKGRQIGVTIYQPHLGPCEHSHYANTI
jgi:hypothetical protein